MGMQAAAAVSSGAADSGCQLCALHHHPTRQITT